MRKKPSSAPYESPAEPIVRGCGDEVHPTLRSRMQLAGLRTDLLDIVVQHPANGVSVLAVTGELDVLTARLRGDCLHEKIVAAPAHLIVDLQR